MGVPKYYRWLSERYPRINQLIEDDSVLPEIDHMYFDMNGIIHLSSHSNDDNTLAAPVTEEEVFENMKLFLDRCISKMIKPKVSVYFAVDGVAPRAKLNQQRGRRFRAGRMRNDIVNSSMKELDTDYIDSFDSNCITPGTAFMSAIDKYMKQYIADRLRGNDPVWKGLQVIYSGSDSPGEGEHKIMQHIRRARSRKDYMANQRHCVYGLDADLIMLGLATHEPHFTILREVVEFQASKDSSSNSTSGQDTDRDASPAPPVLSTAPMQLLHLSVLREYIEVEFADLGMDVRLDRERLIDDFIFLTFLVGNDFIPHLPSLYIGENAFDVIFDAYKLLHSAGNIGYIVENGEISDFDRLEKLFRIIGEQEVNLLRKRDQRQRAFLRGQRSGRIRDLNECIKQPDEMRADWAEVSDVSSSDSGESEEISDIEGQEDQDSDSLVTVVGAETTDKSMELSFTRPTSSSYMIDTGSIVNSQNINDIDLGDVSSIDYREHHYKLKFGVIPGVTPGADEFLSQLTEEYLKSLMWCLAYYTKGCISWSWYYPYCYGPMVIDMTGLATKARNIDFELGQPFLPFQQLLGCLPPTSKNLLPSSYGWIMTSDNSPLRDLYPEDFVEDLDGKFFHWEAVVILPFIDAKKLMEVEKEYCSADLLSPDEKERNSFGNAGLFSATVSRRGERIVKRVEIENDFNPCQPFASELLPGTRIPYHGFPSLRGLPIKYTAMKMLQYTYGYGMRYKTLVLGINNSPCTIGRQHPSQLVGRRVFVNYPLMHEAKVIAVSTKSSYYIGKEAETNYGDGEAGAPLPAVQQVHHSKQEIKDWVHKSALAEQSHMKGSGVVGSSGMAIGRIRTRLIVAPVVGSVRNPVTGKMEKVYGDKEIEVPLQLVRWKNPAHLHGANDNPSRKKMYNSRSYCTFIPRSLRMQQYEYSSPSRLLSRSAKFASRFVK